MRASRNQQFDAIVVGTGVAGLAVAIALARRKKKVLMIGRKGIAGESSPAAAGILDPFLEINSDHPLFKLSCEAFFRYPAWLKQLRKSAKEDLGYARPGLLYVAFNRREEAELKKRFLWQRQSGIPVVWQPRSQIFETEPYLSRQAQCGLLYPTIGRIKPRIFLKVLFSYARGRGVRILKTKEEPHLVTLRNRVQGVRVGSHKYPSQTVINATGAWAGKNPHLGIRPPIVPARGQILVVRGKRVTTRILHSLTGFYVVPWGRNTFLLGSTVEFAGFRAGTTRRGIGKIRKSAEKLIPGLKSFKGVDQWAGLRPFSKGRLPLIGPTSIEGLYWMLGFYRSGILISCYAGELMAEGILSGNWPKIIKPFDPRRLLKAGKH